MSSIGFATPHFQHQVSARRSAIVRPNRTNRIGSGRRKQTIKAMRAVVQRVASASVEVEGRTVSAIGPGLLVLVGIHEADVHADAEYICRKVLGMRLFPNEKTGKTWDQNVMQKNYEVLLVSQFTLCGFLKGNKPDFHLAMSPDAAKPFYASLVERFQKAYKVDAVKDGVFGAMMKVNLVNDGPVTMQLDSGQSSKSTNGVITRIAASVFNLIFHIAFVYSSHLCFLTAIASYDFDLINTKLPGILLSLELILIDS